MDPLHTWTSTLTSTTPSLKQTFAQRLLDENTDTQRVRMSKGVSAQKL